MKVLAPLLEECLLEADENLQTKWASLLANTLAENSTIKTNIFTSTLKEMTTEDAEIFEVIFERCTICTQTEKEIEIIHSGRATSPDAFKGYPDMI